MEEQNIIALLPYQRPFLFVDAIDTVSENEIRGHYTFRKDEYFYQGSSKIVSRNARMTYCNFRDSHLCLSEKLTSRKIENVLL